MKPFSDACEQNKWPILGVLRAEFATVGRVLEIGSGTGQHAVFFAAELPHLTWYATDMPEHHPGMRAWLADALHITVNGPYVLDVNQDEWPDFDVDGVFSANTAHIMDWPSVVNMFQGVGRILQPRGTFCLYGPFNYGGQYTSESNARFDAWLKARDPASGIRDFTDLEAIASENGLVLRHDYEMPVNNRTLVWEKRGRGE